MTFTEKANAIFQRAIDDYHVTDNINTPINNPYADSSIDAMLYKKCWIDTVQWHFEDIIRDPNIDPKEGMTLKHRIDKSNQDRTDLVEEIDSYFRNTYKDVTVRPDATINTESPAWAVDRLSILALKIYHMREQAERKDASADHVAKCRGKLDILLQQQKDLSTAIDQLLADIAAGRKYMKVYRQMKMYNDADTNPVLYGKK
ncbi:MAG: DUF4254 domain-containing protein [Prevotella sp.]|uniref:DUF4254 domain-containing protein n=1 Tax=Prevotella sp. AGR2160 TaxID=1280674 RepID=UPI0003F92D5F|nr:DUF4254 domain-containing protein [Prevotella sp. AGR2160]MDD5862849.1 DUF4254 domain-containing protein [Prevotella sp.]